MRSSRTADVDAGQGGDGDDLLEGQEVLVALDDGQDLVLPDGVDLVDEEEDGLQLHLPEDLDDELVAVAEGLGGVDEEAEEVGRLQRGEDEVHHPPVEGVEGLVDAGVVDEDDLAPVGGLDAQDADAGRLGLVRDDGDLLAEKGVDERGLADVRAAEEGHGADPEQRASSERSGTTAFSGRASLPGPFSAPASRSRASWRRPSLPAPSRGRSFRPLSPFSPWRSFP